MTNKPHDFDYLFLFAYVVLAGIPWYILIAWGIQTKEPETLVILIVCALFLIFPLFLFFWKKKTKILCLGTLLLILTLVSVRCIFWPLPGHLINSPLSPLQPIYTKDAIPSRFGWNLLSEEEWIRLGVGASSIMAITDWQKTFIGEYIEKTYPKIRKDPIFQNINSVLDIGFSGQFNPEPSGFHHFVYTPEKPVDDKLIVFLQGNACNFLVYPWIFRNLSDATHQKITFPSFLFGDWQLPGGMESIAHAVTMSSSGAMELNLLGLSNGGRGISRYIRDHGGQVKKAVYISAILEEEIITNPNFIENAQKMDGILIIHGEKDDRVLIDSIHKAVKILIANNIKVSVVFYSKSDHFLLFEKEKEKEIVDIIAEFLDNKIPFVTWGKVLEITR